MLLARVPLGNHLLSLGVGFISVVRNNIKSLDFSALWQELLVHIHISFVFGLCLEILSLSCLPVSDASCFICKSLRGHVGRLGLVEMAAEHLGVHSLIICVSFRVVLDSTRHWGVS